MKFSLVGSYNLADGYLGAANALKNINHEVEFIPAHLYKSEYPADHVQKIINDLKNQKPDVILWWRAETLNPIELKKIRKEISGKFIMFSWDDPHQWERNTGLKLKCKMLDVAFSCCQGSLEDYEMNGCPKAVYCLPGFDPEVHFPEEDDNYKCDISIVCTNLYHGNLITNYPHLSRLDLLNKLISVFPEKDIRIYGSENFKEIFGDRYCGWVRFEESRKVFYNSKINLSTHIRPDGYKYINERVCQILGSKGLLLMDLVNGIVEVFDVGKECLILNTSSDDCLRNQIDDILENTEDYNPIRENGYKKAIKEITWECWAKKIVEGIQ